VKHSQEKNKKVEMWVKRETKSIKVLTDNDFTGKNVKQNEKK
jgi:hypothetical protein